MVWTMGCTTMYNHLESITWCFRSHLTRMKWPIWIVCYTLPSVRANVQNSWRTFPLRLISVPGLLGLGARRTRPFRLKGPNSPVPRTFGGKPVLCGSVGHRWRCEIAVQKSNPHLRRLVQSLLASVTSRGRLTSVDHKVTTRGSLTWCTVEWIHAIDASRVAIFTA